MCTIIAMKFLPDQQSNFKNQLLFMVISTFTILYTYIYKKNF